MEGPAGLTCVEEIDARLASAEFKLWTETETREDGMQLLSEISELKRARLRVMEEQRELILEQMVAREEQGQGLSVKPASEVVGERSGFEEQIVSGLGDSLGGHRVIASRRRASLRPWLATLRSCAPVRE